MALGRTTWLIIRKEDGFVNTFLKNFSRNFLRVINDKKVEYIEGNRTFSASFFLDYERGSVFGVQQSAKKNKKKFKVRSSSAANRSLDRLGFGARKRNELAAQTGRTPTIRKVNWKTDCNLFKNSSHNS